MKKAGVKRVVKISPLKNKKKFYYLVVGILSLALVAQLAFAGNYLLTSGKAPITDWGLSYQQQGEKPVGNASAEYLAPYNAYYVGSSSTDKVVYLTFDAGYENGYTEKILDILKAQDVKAIFFLTGHYIKSNSDLVKRMVAEGHLVGNHTMNHPDMTKYTDLESFKKELSGLEDLFYETTNTKIANYYRPPSGKFNESNLTFAKELGYKTIFWSLAYADWLTDKQPTPQTALDKILPRIHPGAIILLHSTSKTNSEILEQVITKVKADGYVFKSLDELK